MHINRRVCSHPKLLLFWLPSERYICIVVLVLALVWLWVSRMAAVLQTAGSRQEIVATLRQHVRRLETSAGRVLEGVCGSGCSALDRLLPERGFPAGTLVEWIARHEASGAGTLALVAARVAAERGGAVVVLDRAQSFYPPAAAALGLDLRRVVVVRARTRDDELWSFDQALRCPGVAAVWGALDQVNQHWFRRLQLAAESGGVNGYLIRPARTRGWPTWAYAQLLVEPRPLVGGQASATLRRWRVEVMRCHGSAGGGAVELELDDLTGTLRESIHETRAVPLASQLAHSTAHRRSAGA